MQPIHVENIILVPRERARQLRATFDVRIAGIGLIRACRLLETEEGRPYVLGPSLQDSHRGWFQTVHFDPEKADEIRDAVVSVLPMYSNRAKA